MNHSATKHQANQVKARQSPRSIFQPIKVMGVAECRRKFRFVEQFYYTCEPMISRESRKGTGVRQLRWGSMNMYCPPPQHNPKSWRSDKTQPYWELEHKTPNTLFWSISSQSGTYLPSIFLSRWFRVNLPCSVWQELIVRDGTIRGAHDKVILSTGVDGGLLPFPDQLHHTLWRETILCALHGA